MAHLNIPFFLIVEIFAGEGRFGAAFARNVIQFRDFPFLTRRHFS